MRSFWVLVKQARCHYQKCENASNWLRKRPPTGPETWVAAGRSAAVPRHSSTDHVTLSERSETHPLADVLRLGTAALRGSVEKRRLPSIALSSSGWSMSAFPSLHYSGAEHDRPELKWTQCSFIQPQIEQNHAFLRLL